MSRSLAPVPAPTKVGSRAEAGLEREKAANRAFARAYLISAIGSGVGSGELALVAVVALASSAFQVSMLAAVSGLVGAVLALPVGTSIARGRSVRTLRLADAVRCLALLGISLAVLTRVLRFWELCAVGAIVAGANILGDTARATYIKQQFSGRRLHTENTRVESIRWITQSAGPAVGGVVISVFGVAFSTATDAASFATSGLLLRSARESAAAATPGSTETRREALTQGWWVVWRLAPLRRMLLCAIAFGGGVMMLSPLLTVFAIRTLALPVWQYGLAMGIACIAGFAGAQLSRVLVRVWGVRRVVLASGVFRALWVAVLLLGGSVLGGFTAVVLSESGLLLGAGCFAPAFATFRMELTSPEVFGRVAVTWSVILSAMQPIFIVVGGVVAATVDVRAAIAGAAVLVAVSIAALPWGALGESRAGSPM